MNLDPVLLDRIQAGFTFAFHIIFPSFTIGLSAYVASKHGVVGLTKTAALEYAKAGIRVNAVCPGVIQTPMVARLTSQRPEMAEALVAAEPMGRTGKPEEIAEAVVWLCSEAASFVTGHAMSVDGGYVAQ